MGYSHKQMKDLQDTINKANCDVVIDGSPFDLSKLLKIKKPIVNIDYELGEEASKQLEKILKGLKLKKKR